MSRSTGVCNVMGTASTMAVMVEALGMSLPHNAAIPAPRFAPLTLAQLTGRRIVEMVHEDLRSRRSSRARRSRTRSASTAPSAVRPMP